MEDELFDEYGDTDAISCSCGDYNAFEEREVFHDREWEQDFDYEDSYDYPED